MPQFCLASRAMPESPIDLLKQAVSYCRENDLPTIFRQVKSKDAHPVLQFIKYGFCGVIATVFSMSVWLLSVYTFLPAMDGMLIDGEPISDETRAWNSTRANMLGFVVGNFVAYFSNLAFVFEGGRHSRLKEFTYFSAVALFATVAGLVAGPLLIKWFGISTAVSQLSLLVTAVLVNYVCRKFFVFKG